MERYHSIRTGDIFKDGKSGRRIIVVGLPGKVTVECRALDAKETAAVFQAGVWISVRDGGEHLRVPGKPEMYCRDGRAEEPPAGRAHSNFVIAA